MKKQDILILVLLVGAMMAWPFVDRFIIKPNFYHTPPNEPIARAAAEPEAAATNDAPPLGKTPELAAPEAPPPEKQSESAPTGLVEETDAVEEAPATPERLYALVNSNVTVVISSHGGGIVSATLKQYRERNEPDSGPVFLDFKGKNALLYDGLPGVLKYGDCQVVMGEDGRSAVITRSLGEHLSFRRSMDLGDDYILSINDTFTVDGEDALTVPDHGIQLGPMRSLGGRKTRGVVSLGVDSLSPGEKAVHWGRKIGRWFKNQGKLTGRIPVELRHEPAIEGGVDWMAVKNKYFLQFLQPLDGGMGIEISARRKLAPGEGVDPNLRPKMQPLEDVSAVLTLPGGRIEPTEPLVREYTYYIGPKQYSSLLEVGPSAVAVMNFGKLAPISKLLLRTLLALHDWIWPHNYGLAIILLTVIIRIIFWPVTHKSTESMKRMQELQPKIKEIREATKDAQKQQKQIMELYKKHKVNPVGGCLPIVIQIPVFIALFSVLRSAIELRFAPFLWIADLSEPENLFAGVLPIPLNILPLVMAATMFWQQKLTPSAGDSQQQKMMAFMPVMMLVFFYNFASGLVVYWTTNQCLMIAQQIIMRRKSEKKQAAATGGARA